MREMIKYTKYSAVQKVNQQTFFKNGKLIEYRALNFLKSKNRQAFQKMSKDETKYKTRLSFKKSINKTTIVNTRAPT